MVASLLLSHNLAVPSSSHLISGMDDFDFTIGLYYWWKIKNNPYKYEGGEVKIYEDNNSDEMSLVLDMTVASETSRRITNFYKNTQVQKRTKFLVDKYVEVKALVEINVYLKWIETVQGSSNMLNSGI